jgi:hypothetical protein
VIFRIGILLPGIVSPVRQKNEELCLKKLKDSSAFRVIPGIVTGVSGIVTADSGEPVKIGHDETESAVTFDRNTHPEAPGTLLSESRRGCTGRILFAILTSF